MKNTATLRLLRLQLRRQVVLLECDHIEKALDLQKKIDKTLLLLQSNNETGQNKLQSLIKDCIELNDRVTGLWETTLKNTSQQIFQIQTEKKIQEFLASKEKK